MKAEKMEVYTTVVHAARPRLSCESISIAELAAEFITPMLCSSVSQDAEARLQDAIAQIDHAIFEWSGGRFGCRVSCVVDRDSSSCAITDVKLFRR